MSSVPMIGSGKTPGISLIGCSAESALNASPPQKILDVHQTEEPADPNAQQPSAAPLIPPSDSCQQVAVEKLVSPVLTTGSEYSAATSPDEGGGRRKQRCGGVTAPTKGISQHNGTSQENRGNAAQQIRKHNGVLSGNGNEFRGGVPVKLHRVREVREQQGLSVRSVARRIGIDVRSYRKLEDPSHNLTLSELHLIQTALDVPFADLLVDRHGLSRPVNERAKLVKVMKSAVAIREAKSTPRVERLAEMLCEQLTDLMPELADVSGWPQFGARRGQSALGKALREPIDTSQLGLSE